MVAETVETFTFASFAHINSTVNNPEIEINWPLLKSVSGDF